MHTSAVDKSFRTRRDLGIAVVALVILVAAALRPLLQELLDRPAIGHWSTIFVAITIQATPFLVLGVTISAAIAAYVPSGALPKLLPKNPAAAVPVAAVAGAALPGCECGSVPIASRLITRGAPVAAALTFLLSAPAINPVVLVATAVAFPNDPEMWVARLLASLLASMAVGLVWVKLGREEWLGRARRGHVHEGTKGQVFVGTAQHDLLHAGGYLIVGAATAATLQTVVPRGVLDTVAGAEVLSVIALGGLAVIMAICSEADAFIAASLTQFSLTARLAFLVVGPMVDLKLFAMQAGILGRRFAVRFAPATFALAIVVSVAVGTVLL